MSSNTTSFSRCESRRLEDDFRTLIATGFEFPEVKLPFHLEPKLDSQEFKFSDTTGVTGASIPTDVPSEDADNSGSARGVLLPGTPELSELEVIPAAGHLGGISGEGAYPVHSFSGDYPDRAQIIEDWRPQINATLSLADDPSTRECSEVRSSLSIKDEASSKPLQVSRIVMSRYDRVEIYRQVWSVTIDRAKEILGIRSLTTVCQSLHIPCPPIGYWQKRAANKQVDPAPPLPPVQISETGRIVDTTNVVFG